MKAHLLDVFENRLRLEGRLTTRTGLHIGAGGSGDPLGTDLPVVRNAAGEVYVPGSSLKGVVRSAAEALLRGGGQPRAGAADKLWACNPFAEVAKNNGAALPKERQVCLTHEQVEAIRKQHPDDPRAAAEKVWAGSCTICRLFGSLALASRVRFPDLPLAAPFGGLELRNGVGIDRDKELAADKVLYDFEAVPPGTSFELRVILDNASDDEIGLILYLFDELDQGHLALGGKTSRGLGLVQVSWSEIVETKLNQANPFSRLLSSRDLLGPEPATEAVPEASSDADPAKEPEIALPMTGNPADWRLLAELIRAMPKFDRSQLGQQANERGLQKKQLNQRLGLGLNDKHVPQFWETALSRLVDCGLLVRTNGDFEIAGREEAPAETPAVSVESARPAPLQKTFDRYVGAMARRWQECFACSPNN